VSLYHELEGERRRRGLGIFPSSLSARAGECTWASELDKTWGPSVLLGTQASMYAAVGARHSSPRASSGWRLFVLKARPAIVLTILNLCPDAHTRSGNARVQQFCEEGPSAVGAGRPPGSLTAPACVTSTLELAASVHKGFRGQSGKAVARWPSSASGLSWTTYDQKSKNVLTFLKTL
jgi:hypothetical protein